MLLFIKKIKQLFFIFLLLKRIIFFALIQWLIINLFVPIYLNKITVLQLINLKIFININCKINILTFSFFFAYYFIFLFCYF